MATPQVQAILYRILGNDLPPRYSPGQTLANLRFTLEHEPELPGLEKRWLLNRIVDPDTLAVLQDTIRSAGQRFDVIPFEEEAYRQVWTDLGDTPPECHPWSEEYQQLPRLMQLRISDYIARFKNQYLMNNNGARNRAIALGLADAEWVLPWDGGCFLPDWSWDEMRAAMADEALHYLCVPMHRLADNAVMPGAENRDTVAWDEPQLAFSRHAQLHFDEQLRYGSMPKALLLRRIGLPGPWQHSEEGWLPWEKPDLSLAPDAGCFHEAALVLRLSGERQDGRYTDVHGLWSLRFTSILAFIRRMDVESVRYALMRQRYHCWTHLERSASKLPDARFRALVRRQVAGPSFPDPPWELICWLSLDAALNRSEPSRENAFELVNRWCLARETAWSPAAHSLQGAAKLELIYPLLDAFTLLQEAQVFTSQQWADLQGWCSDLLNWLISGSKEFLTSKHPLAAASWHHLSVLALSTFLGRADLCCQVIDNLPGLLVGQYRSDGSPQAVIAQASETKSNLHAWLQLALLNESLHRDLLGYRTSAGLSLQQILAVAQNESVSELGQSSALIGSDSSMLIPDLICYA